VIAVGLLTTPEQEYFFPQDTYSYLCGTINARRDSASEHFSASLFISVSSEIVKSFYIHIPDRFVYSELFEYSLNFGNTLIKQFPNLLLQSY